MNRSAQRRAEHSGVLLRVEPLGIDHDAPPAQRAQRECAHLPLLIRQQLFEYLAAALALVALEPHRGDRAPGPGVCRLQQPIERLPLKRRRIVEHAGLDLRRARGPGPGPKNAGRRQDPQPTPDETRVRHVRSLRGPSLEIGELFLQPSKFLIRHSIFLPRN